MKDFWTFIGGVAVGILAVTGVYAFEEETTRFVEHDENEAEKLEDEIEEDTDDEGELIVGAS
ncbi:hypothetical protein SYK_28320 [Pseudodesulfovibrio nedwellii]|uniref:Uncharacterized protein n=1 Tax=Pseudodesulfovibrio nedwellii TaxID=2973072 RepID=A0ABM8B3Z6_9BACT|nr:hypothetical protein [Pseudodesulfovibrio nedwellii]BDQ38472.1 hypothetical protein SYK_28320 [Pseudodesulfovibrio nedwellii]